MPRWTFRAGTPAPPDDARTTPPDEPELVGLYLRWVWWRALLHRGWWLVASVYLVVDAGLTASQLVLVGVAQGAVALVVELPAGVVADTLGRKPSLLASHALMGAAMLATGLVTDFAALLATQMLWGVSWTFASGADVAYVTDELADPARIDGVLVRSGRAQLTGAAAGIAAFAALGSALERSTALVLAGAAMLALGLYVLARFREERFAPVRARRWEAARKTFVRGSALVRGSRALLLVLAATFLVTGAAAATGRLRERRLLELGLPADPVLWLGALGVLTLLAGAVVLRAVERRVDEPGAALRGYALACAVGAAGAAVFAVAPEEVTGGAAVLLVAGVATPVARTLGAIWVNRQTDGAVRATVHSFLAQAEYLGAIACGLAVAGTARLAGLPASLLACAGLFALALLVTRGAARAGSRPGAPPLRSRSSG